MPHARTRHFLAATLAFVLWTPPAVAQSVEVAPALDEAAETITEATAHEHISFLASEELRGRDTPSPGLERAAEYLVEHHRSHGLEPAGEDGTYYQRYPFRLGGPDLGSADLSFDGPGGSVDIPVGQEAFLMGGTDEPLDAPLTFVRAPAGAAPEEGSLEGRIAVFLLPGDWGELLWLTAGEQATFAEASGAVGAVHVLDAAFPPQAVAQLGASLAQPTWQLGDAAIFPRIFVRGGIADKALGQSSTGWDELEERARAGESVSEDLEDVRLRGRMPLNLLEDSEPPNILAALPGSDPELADEYIVLSAHFDHVGVGQPMDGDSIYNGADDNASGTTALLEVARVLASLPDEERPRRTVVFAHVSGEEKGLLGSEWWADNPTLPIDDVVANINADMVGGDAHPDTLVVLGLEYSSLGPLVQDVNERMPELGLTTAPDLWPEERLFFRSDQLNFMRKEIPSIFLFTGLHDCYHRPCDDIDFVDEDKVARVSRLLAHTVMEIANRDARPEWDPEGLAEVRQMISGGR